MTVSSVVFSGDGKTLATGSYDDEIMLLWDVATGTELQTFSGHAGGVNSIAFNFDGSILAGGSDEKNNTSMESEYW